jgi:hypothetical protein
MWRDVVRVYRRLEMRGEIRGGRFVAGVAGEQYGLFDAVERIRKVRDASAETEWLVISATDPLNLVGFITSHSRVPATRANRIVFVDGQPVAALEGGDGRWLAEVDEPTRMQAAHMLSCVAYERPMVDVEKYAVSSNGRQLRGPLAIVAMASRQLGFNGVHLNLHLLVGTHRYGIL